MIKPNHALFVPPAIYLPWIPPFPARPSRALILLRHWLWGIPCIERHIEPHHPNIVGGTLNNHENYGRAV